MNYKTKLMMQILIEHEAEWDQKQDKKSAAFSRIFEWKCDIYDLNAIWESNTNPEGSAFMYYRLRIDIW